MNLRLRIHFFKSALDEPSTSAGHIEAPIQAGLLLEGIDEPIGIELFDIQTTDDGANLVLARTLNPEIGDRILEAGLEFFLTKSGKMLGRGTVLEGAP